MTDFFGIPIETLTQSLIIITCSIVAGVILLALGNAIFFKIGVRNISRRRLQMVLIVFALMLSTTLLSSVLATGDVLTAAVQSVAVYNWGNIDELIEGGRGELGLYRDDIYTRLHSYAERNPHIAAVGAALRESELLIADQSSRQVRSQVTALGVLPGSERGFGGMQDQTNGKQLTIGELGSDQAYLNLTLAQLLNARAGDKLYLYSQRWPGQRYTLHVRAIVGNNGLVGDSPYLLTHVQTFQQIEHASHKINQIFIANAGGGGVSGVDLSTTVSQALEDQLPHHVHVIKVKEQGVQNSQKAQDIFSRIFALFALFALAISLLLIFLIFVLLAAERRSEMGMARALGVQRHQLVLMFLFEGAVYDLLASFIGLLLGVGVGALLVTLLGPILTRFNFPLKLTFQPHSLIIAYCLGVIFTFFSVALSSWIVSRMTVVEAIRDLPEPARPIYALRELPSRLATLSKQMLRVRAGTEKRPLRYGRRILLEYLPAVLLALLSTLTRLGLLPLLAGIGFMRLGLDTLQIIPFSLGLSLVIIGAGLLLKTLLEQGFLLICRKYSLGEASQKSIAGISIALMGLALVAYWALPFDALARLGLPRFAAGIEVFFVAGFMMILGMVWALITNAEILTRPLLALCSRLAGFYAIAKLASAYPLQRRLRTGLSIIMFSMVVFTMTVMAVITNSMQQTYVDINAQTGGYDIQAKAYFKALPDLSSSLAKNGIDPRSFSVIGERTTTAVGVLQLSANAPRWSLYPAQVVSGGFLQGYGLHLTARAQGLTSDSAVWQALQSHPDYALIDSSALPYNSNDLLAPVYDPNTPSASQAGISATPPGLDPRYTFALSGVYQGEKSFPATPLWVIGLQNQKAVKLTIIGVVDNSDSAHFGLYIPQSSYSSGIANPKGSQGDTPEAQTYYFKAAPGQDKRGLALKLGSAFLDDGLETTVLEDAIWQLRGPRILLSNVLLGIVGITLLLGVAALAITGTRAVVERRQQIGMLRALGCGRKLIQGAFLLESFLVGALGSALGIVLGLILARNIFAANFFERYQTGLTFGIPWQQLALIVGVALLASFLGALLPAWQAGKVAPAEALRYQ
ncbi:FtsX-like permease family protein [Ktedonosporobacter rubrisoli]|uniref:FtsX-like permease family protein n=1 Tax=Ktedonosporobacter rubrisoli TaxID=2509675 RepID=A0A4P6JVM3_KTERU|nr:FtsX-like permease family protein [Ktedonosporobacter rubrisoli]QBD79390.1 FtsX-like permease family protein [Ktedonosporobacter rubrisoli]